MTPTRLFYLAPLGASSVEVESLTSYVRRLALAHVVSSTTLIRDLLLKPQRLANARINLMFEPSRSTESLNGSSAASRLVVSGLEALTGRRDLGITTFGAVTDAIELGAAFRTFRAWCPMCLRADQPYDRLAWSLSVWRICAIHGLPLRDHCGQCGARHRPLSPRATPHVCPGCGAPFGQYTSAETSRSDDSQRIAERLLVLQSKGRHLDREASMLMFCAAAKSIGGLRPLARRSGISPSELAAVVSGHVRPNLATFTRCSIAFPQALEQLDWAAPARTTAQFVGRWRAEQGSRPIVPQIKDRLHAVLKLPDGRLPSVRSFARSCGTTPAYLRAALPTETGQLVRRRTQAVRQRRSDREARLALMVTSTLREMAVQGPFWSRRQLEARLPNAGILRAPAVRSIVRSHLLRDAPQIPSRTPSSAKSGQAGITSDSNELEAAPVRRLGPGDD